MTCLLTSLSSPSRLHLRNVPRCHRQDRTLVFLHGSTQLAVSSLHRFRQHEVGERPPDPARLNDPDLLQKHVDKLVNWFSGKNQVLALTGAGLSTESGIPDYRGYHGSYYDGHKPIIHDQFVKSEYHRKRYWSRGLIGWKDLHQRKPNQGHYAMANLVKNKRLGVNTTTASIAIVTQNVDRLHSRAANDYQESSIIELHGRTDELRCLQCDSRHDRKEYHSTLEQINREWLERNTSILGSHEEMTDRKELRPDGDALLLTNDFASFEVPSCHHCQTGIWKPDVVFFGDSVPRDRVALVSEAVDHCDGLLVVGSSLMVYSAFRHVRRACAKGTPVAIVNVGSTRAEHEGLEGIAKIEGPSGAVLHGLNTALSSELM